MLFKEIIAVYSENCKTLCGQNAELLIVKAGGTLLPLGFTGLNSKLPLSIYSNSLCPKQLGK
jgi:hypothetical protein